MHLKGFKVGFMLKMKIIAGGSYWVQPTGTMQAAVLPQDGKLIPMCWHPSPLCAVHSRSHELGITPWGY